MTRLRAAEPDGAVPIVVVGRGRIGGAVADWLARGPDYDLLAVLGRGEAVPPAAAIVVDAAGPAFLRAHGERLLASHEVWSVGAAALVDPDLAARMRAAARAGRGRLRLFTPWIAGPALCPAGIAGRLFVRQSAPGLAAAPGRLFDGPLAEAARLFPDHLNTATAAALAGPGIAATHVRLTCSQPGRPHVISSRFEMPGSTMSTRIRLDVAPGALHPVAAALVAALEARAARVSYG